MTETSSTETWDAFFRALGELYHSFTVIEATMAQAIAVAIAWPTTSKKHSYAALAVVNTGRMKVLKSTIKRILRVTQAPAEHQSSVEKVFAHLGDIQFLRDRLAHYPTDLVEGSDPPVFENSDAGLASEVGKAEALIFQVSALEAAASDLRAVRFFIDLILQDLVEPLRELPSEFVEHARKLPSWRYKPSMLTRRRPQFDDSHLAPWLPPDASPE